MEREMLRLLNLSKQAIEKQRALIDRLEKSNNNSFRDWIWALIVGVTLGLNIAYMVYSS